MRIHGAVWWGVMGMLAGFAGSQGMARAAGRDWSVASPNGGLSASVTLSEDGRLTYRVARGGRVVLDASPLGIERADQKFRTGLRFDTEQRARVAEAYTMVTGKRRACRGEANELTLSFANAANAKLDLVLRAADDGIALRYRFPETDPTVRTVTAEQTGFALPAGSRGWLLPYDEATKWTPAYEQFYEMDVPVGTPSPKAAGWCFPALFRLPGDGGWALLTEALLDGTYCGTRLAAESPGGLYRIRLPDPGEGNGVGAVEPSSTLPWATPWRVVLVGPTPATFVESTLVTDLCPPSQIADTAWIRPGRAAWSWWSDQESPRRPERMKPFIDLAAELGWEYFLVDANWNEIPEAEFRDLLAYAKQKGVGILLWYNSGGPHNVVTEAPRDRMMPADVRRKELARLRELGVAGVKVDFFQSDKQNMVQHYLDILADAAAARILVNVHGCTVPRGWSRTWPNLMSMEGVRGAECYIFDKLYPERAPRHNTVLVFARNAVGPMDYTPVTFSDNNNRRLTTHAHELALAVVFESGWIHPADSVQGYRSVPDYVREFLRALPTAWDETRCLGGTPGDHAIVARRKDGDWWVGGISGREQGATFDVPLAFLGDGAWKAELIADGETDRVFRHDTEPVARDGTLRIETRARGGFALRIAR